MDDIDLGFPNLIQGLEEMTGTITAERARAQSGVISGQVLGEQWPGVRASAGPARRVLSQKPAGPGAARGKPAPGKVRQSG